MRKPRGDEQKQGGIAADAAAHRFELIALAVELQEGCGEKIIGIEAERVAGDTAKGGGKGGGERVTISALGPSQRHGQIENIRGDEKDRALDEGDDGEPGLCGFARRMREGPCVKSSQHERAGNRRAGDLSIALVFAGPRCSQPLDLGAPGLGVQSSPFRGKRRPCRPARLWRHGGAADQIDKPGEGFGAIALLLAEALRLYNKHAVIVHAPAGEAPQAGKEIWFNRGRAGRIEAQLDRGRQLVDVLPAGPGGADEALGEFALVDRQGRGDLNHGGQSSGRAGA